MKIETNDDRLMAIAAFRYCLGRRTYIASCCVEWLLAHWTQIGESDKALIKREIHEAIEMSAAGDKCDIAEWEKLLSA